jgi:Putative prokaryotic signal transducing protein
MPANPDLVVIQRAPSTAMAEELQSLLAASGIESFVDPYSSEETVAGEIYSAFTGIDVRVKAPDLARARAILDEAHQAGELAEDAGDDTLESEA